MDRSRFDTTSVPSNSINGGLAAKSSCPPPRPPNYTCSPVQVALKRLAAMDPIDLCNEAKVECCRATRDLRSCGRNVHSVLKSCGHASLCEECSQRCDVCPICRIPLPKDENRLCLRLYYECIEAGLISKMCDDWLQEREDSERHLIPDIERLYSLFDVALENNLSSLICHYITDVCMDESAVSSDPVIAFLLDEVVVKDWCKQMFKNILTEVQRIYNLTGQEIKESLTSLMKFSVKLAGMSNILEVLESSFRSSTSAKLHDLHHLQESILKTKQHMETLIWCIRHQFLEDVRSRHANIQSWRSHVRERKLAAVARAWPDFINRPVESGRQNCATLFIEDALHNLDKEQEDIDECVREVDITCLQKDGGSSFFRAKIEGMSGSYPFENIRVATDILFLQGSSDLVVAKQAIFLYYLFDRHWTMSDEEWRYIIDDFAATFGVTRHLLLESFTFYLLDDHTDKAIQEACHLLPEISNARIHPKVAQVLLERQNPDAALMVLRWSGRDSGAELVSLEEAVTAVRVRVECALLTEAFMYQRTLCTKVKEKKLREGSLRYSSQETNDECYTWEFWMEALVIEICSLCIRRNLIDRMIELPWNLNEEKHLCKCLLDFAMDDPSTTIGSLLVVFYLQRHRYVEAYQVDRKLHTAEENFISCNPASESRMRSRMQLRAGLVDKSIQLLPEIVQHQVRTGKLSEIVLYSGTEVDTTAKADLSNVQEPILTSLLVPSPVDSSLSRDKTAVGSVKPSAFETPSKMIRPTNIFSEVGRYGASILSTHLINGTEKEVKHHSVLNKSLKHDEISASENHRESPVPSFSGELSRRSSRIPWDSHFSNQINKVSPGVKNGLTGQSQISNQYPRKTVGAAVNSFGGNSTASIQDSFVGKSAQTSYLNASGKRAPSDRADRSWVPPANDSMDFSWSHRDKASTILSVNANGGPRWRADDSSEEDEDTPDLDRFAGVASSARHSRGISKSRIARR